MQNKIIKNIGVILIYLIASISFGINENHLASLKSKFPFGLISDDYEILNLSDLEINACQVTPRPFDPNVKKFYPYEYWQCFKNSNISFECDSNGARDEYEGVMGLVVIKILNNGVLHEYIEHRLWPIKDCKDFIKDAKFLLKGVNHVCFSGSFVSKEIDSKGNQTISWSFERIKSKKGCEGRGCDFTQEFKKNICPNE